MFLSGNRLLQETLSILFRRRILVQARQIATNTVIFQYMVEQRKRLFYFSNGKQNQSHTQNRQGHRTRKRKPEGIGFV